MESLFDRKQLLPTRSSRAATRSSRGGTQSAVHQPHRSLSPAAARKPGPRAAPGGPHDVGSNPGRPKALGLLLVSAPDAGLVGTYYELDSTSMVIGRMSAAKVNINDLGVSRNHVRITRNESGEVIAEDLGSTNGTWVNGVAIRTAMLAPGDRLQIGDTTEFIFGVQPGSARSEIRLAQAVATAGAGTWEWRVDGNGLRFGGGIATAIGLGADTTDPHAGESWLRVHPDDRDGLRERLEVAQRDGGRFEHEVRLLRRGAPLWVALTGERFQEADGRPGRLAGTLLDISERRRADAELRRQSLLFESLTDAVVVVGADGTILDWSASAQRLLGWTKAEVLGRRPGILLLPADSERLDQPLAQSARDGERRVAELVITDKSGAELQVEVVAAPLVARQEELVGCVAIFRDLGERKRMQAQLQVAERLAALGTLAAGVAHEINNPLAFVSSNLDFLTQQLAKAAGALGPGHQDLMGALSDSTRGVERIAAIVRDLQTFNRRELAGTPDEVDPNGALEFALRLAQSAMGRQVRVVKDLKPVPHVAGGEARLGHVFFNVLVNAGQSLDANRPEVGAVRVSTAFDEAAGMVIIEVSDEGAGMPPEIVAHIFDPFFTTRPVGSGTGLGLFVTHAIVHELGGEITVKSKIGEGTTIRIALPSVGPAPKAAPPLPRVLLVDDEAMFGTAVRRAFAGRYEIVALTDPLEALARVQHGEKFLLAVVDLVMPKMSGREFLARLRQFDPAFAARSVVFTGAALEDAQAAFPPDERPTILRKTLDFAQLAARLGELRDAQEK